MKNIPQQLPCPPQNPDLYSIENLFAWVKQNHLQRGPRTINDLKRDLKFCGISPDFLQP